MTSAKQSLVNACAAIGKQFLLRELFLRLVSRNDMDVNEHV